LGTSPLTAFIESASGIKEGARTGIAAITVSRRRLRYLAHQL
jgi:AGZA family xanthine/uracil permease-like MFS transporter